MRVLNLVTTERSRFFDQQRRALETHGVSEHTLTVPNNRVHGGGESSGRSIADYARFLPPVIEQSFRGYDLVHANYGLTAPHALAQPNLPVVVSLWGTDLMGEYGWLSKRCARYADETVVMSERMADELDTSCHVIPHGVDLDLFRPMDQGEVRAELGWDDDVRQVLFPYPPERGVKNYSRAERVVDAVDEARDEPVRIQTVTGEPHDRMPIYMNAADALLLTSRREGSPNAVKEALACDTPVVATDVGDVPERLADVGASTVGHDDDELVEGLQAALDADGRAEGGREAAEKVSIEHTSARLRAVYDRVV